MKLLTFKATTHSAKSARFGAPISAAAMEARIDEPGPIELKTVGANWEAPITGLLNIKHPKAVAAGITDRKEPIKIYAHVLRHPAYGFFLVDTGVSRKLVEDPVGVGVGMMLRKFGGIEKMDTQQTTADIIAAEGVPLNGVFMTHLHLDHVSGLPDIPKGVPIYTGADEAEASLFLNLFAQGTYNHLLAGRPPLEELQFEKDLGGKLEGVNDVFGDGSFFAILTPGHTTGHVSYIACTPTGPVLMTGDVCHTRWGWDNGVEPGTYMQEREPSIKSFNQLKDLSERHPDMIVRLGHQE
ncbi:MBL fold metallo-hydrolase [Streptomyces sp. NPDC101234]|uniref:MBL fold metallo-hydrolase n=1 Tax=Streptomyces sp. NPDC101234 TaxID=3366138 RepID=UPI003822F573